MILRLYSSSQPLLLISVPVLAALGLLPFALGLPMESAALNYPAESWFIQLNQWSLGYVVAAWILISLGAWRVNAVFNHHEFHTSAVFMPGLTYTIFALICCHREFSLAGLTANVFVIGGFDQILRVYRQHRAHSEYFKTGLYWGSAALFFPPFIVFAFALWIAISFTRTFVWREYVLSALAFATPFAWWLAMRFFLEIQDPPTLFFWQKDVDLLEAWRAVSAAELVALVFSALAFLFGIPRFLFPRDRATNRSRNLSGVSLIVVLLSSAALALGVWTMGEWNLMAVLMPFTVVTSAWFANYRYSLIAPFVFYAWLAASLFLLLDQSGVF